MSKTELIRRIVQTDAAADAGFLTDFSEEELDQYLRELTPAPVDEALVLVGS